MDLERIAARLAACHVKLRGPFRKSEGTPDGQELDVGGICTAEGPGLAELLPDGPSVAYVEVNWHYETPDPSVGWTGGWEADGWEVTALDDVLLLDEGDRGLASQALENEVEKRLPEWAEEHARRAEEDAFDPPDYDW